jgi:putative component of toxin-antitoxin plasmid stabilization module
MPQVDVIFYREDETACEVVDWLRDLRNTKPKAFAKCFVRVQRLAELGHELRRPECDFLRDGIYELRSRIGNVNYRLLYFFHGRTAAIIAVGLTKEDAVPDVDIDTAIARKSKFIKDSVAHTFAEEL